MSIRARTVGVLASIAFVSLAPAPSAVSAIEGHSDQPQTLPYDGYWRPDASDIEKLERRVEASDPVKVVAYARYYSGFLSRSHHIIRGDYVKFGYKPGVYVDETAPDIFDGGCGVFHVVYDVDADVVLSHYCNGTA
jgi:hypothetical protein